VRPFDRAALGDLGAELGQLLVDNPAPNEVEINPLRVTATGLVALDAVVTGGGRDGQTELTAVSPSADAVATAWEETPCGSRWPVGLGFLRQVQPISSGLGKPQRQWPAAWKRSRRAAWCR
jgi:hypothetical protein